MKLNELLLYGVLIAFLIFIFSTSIFNGIVAVIILLNLMRIWNKPEYRERRKKLHGDGSFISFLKRLFK